MLEEQLLSESSHQKSSTLVATFVDEDGFQVQEQERRHRKRAAQKEIRPRQHPATRKPGVTRDTKRVFVVFRPAVKTASLHSLKRLVTAIRKISRGGLAVHLKEDFDPAGLLTCNSLLDQPVKACLQGSGQPIMATVFCPHVEVDEFLELYQKHEENPPLAHHRPMGTRGRFLLRFLAGPLPEKVILFPDGEPVHVQTFFKDPVQCSRCQRYNHAASDGRSQPACMQCGKSGENHKDCSAAPRCANCDSSHAASSRNCPHRQFEIKFNRQQAAHRCTRVEARSMCEKLKCPVKPTPPWPSSQLLPIAASSSQALSTPVLSTSQPNPTSSRSPGR